MLKLRKNRRQCRPIQRLVFQLTDNHCIADSLEKKANTLKYLLIDEVSDVYAIEEGKNTDLSSVYYQPFS